MNIREKRQKIARLKNEVSELQKEARKTYDIAKELQRKYAIEGINYKFLKASSKAIKANENRQMLATELLKQAAYLDELCYQLTFHYEKIDNRLLLKLASMNEKKRAVYRT